MNNTRTSWRLDEPWGDRITYKPKASQVRIHKSICIDLEDVFHVKL